MRHEDPPCGRLGAGRRPSRASARRRTSTRCSWPGWSTAAPSAASARRASSSRPKACSTRIRAPTREEVRDVVPEAPQRLPLHRLQADRGRGHGRRQGAARRDDAWKSSPSSCPPTDASGTRLPPAHRRWPRSPAPATTAHDLALQMPPDTLQLALVQAKVSHANILGIDTSEAEKMPGVHKVVTHKDVKGKNRITGLITFPSNKGDGWDRPDPLRQQGLPVRRRHRHRLRRHRGARRAPRPTRSRWSWRCCPPT